MSVAVLVVLLFGLSVFVLEFQAGVREAQNRQVQNFHELVDGFTRDVKRRQGRVMLLVHNRLALNAAYQSLKLARKPEPFFGPGVLRFHLIYGEETLSGGSGPGDLPTAASESRQAVLKVVSLSETAETAGLLYAAHSMDSARPVSVHVLWDVSDLLPRKGWAGDDLFHGVTVSGEDGAALWKTSPWEPAPTESKDPLNMREFMWEGKSWVELSKEIPLFTDVTRLHAFYPRALLYSQAWRTSRRILFRTLVLLGIGLSLVVLLAIWLRQVLKPLDDITQGVKRISEGDRETVLDTGGEDEIAFLAETLNDMIHQLKVKEQSVEAHIRLLSEKNEELRQVTERLREADQLKDHFLAVLSHELRTPLTAILGYTELSLDGIYGPLSEKQREILSYVQNNGSKLLALMEDLLDIAKIRAGTIDVNVDEFRLEELVDDIRKFMENALRQKPDVKYVEDVQTDNMVMKTDRVKFEQILTNLLSNAVKFTERGSVKLSVRPADRDVQSPELQTREIPGRDFLQSAKGAGPGRIVFEVEDTGIGIAPQHLPKIFEAFTQLDSTIRRRYGGTGLGLTICKSLIEKLRGTIEVESELGMGCRFRVTLPTTFDPDSAHNKQEGGPA
ncbi:HAMP domain-containing protein [bacterium]|nr:HAMP domain-containing protein [bacterium]